MLQYMNIFEQTEHMQFSFDITQSIKHRATSTLQSYSYDIFQIQIHANVLPQNMEFSSTWLNWHRLEISKIFIPFHVKISTRTTSTTTQK